MSRIGQEHEQICYILVQEDTYNCVLQYRYYSRFKGQEQLDATAGLGMDIINHIAARPLPPVLCRPSSKRAMRNRHPAPHERLFSEMSSAYT
jgi:hypothetical protein